MRWLRNRRCRKSIEANGGRLVLQGMVMKADEPTGNGRVYPLAVLEKSIRDYVADKVENEMGFGELGHPNHSDPGYREVNFRKVSHEVKELLWKRRKLYVTIEVRPDFPKGPDVIRSMLGGCKTGISLRGWSSVIIDQSNPFIKFVQTDLKVIAFDIVAVPAVSQAYLRPYPYKWADVQ